MHNMRDIGAALAEVSSALGELSEDRMTRQLLRSHARQLRLGAIRLAVLGNSNAGKSTLVNALLHTIAVPESGNTSSPIPVWFAAGDELRYSVYLRTEDGERCEQPDREAFLREYCFNLMDITDDKRSRFRDILWASAEIPSDYLRRTGLALIDTLGIGATDADTTKTISVMDGGVDIVVFVTSRVDLRESERKFLRERVLGLDQSDSPSPISPVQLLLVYNDNGMSAATLAQLQASADKLLEGFPEETIEHFKQHNLIMLNALDARRVRCGAYDYQAFAPRGTLPMERNGLAEKTRREAEEVAALSPEAAASARRFDALEQRLSELTHRLMTGVDGVVERHIMRLEAEMNAIRIRANGAIRALQQSQAAVQEKMLRISRVNATFARSNDDIDDVFATLRQELQSAIEHTLEASAEHQRALGGMLLAMNDEPSFITRESMRAFQSAMGLEKEKMLEEWIRIVIEKHFLPEASRKFKKMLLEASVQEGNPHYSEKDTVGFQLKAARRLAMAQSVRMKNFYEQLRDAGAEDIGLSIPTDETIDTWFAGMASEMETAVLDAIAALHEEAFSKFNAVLPGIVREIRVRGIINRIMQMMGDTSKFWLAVRNQAILPAASMICGEWFSARRTNAGNSMYCGIDKACGKVQKKVVDSLREQTGQVDDYLNRLQDELQRRAEDVRQASDDAFDLEAQLQHQHQALAALRIQLHQSRS